MQRLLSFLRLPPADRRLLIEAALLLGTIRLGLALLPFQTMRHLTARLGQAGMPMKAVEHASFERIGWAVTAVSRRFPGTCTCLTQALAAQLMLDRRGHPSRLRIGVARGARGQLQAHAWLESRGMVVIGDLHDLARYVPLPSLERTGT